MTETRRPRGPWTHRVLITVFSILLGLLVYWLLGFVLDDISRWRGPDYAKLEEQMLDPDVLARQERLEEEIAETSRQIEKEQNRQQILRDSTSASRETMNQLLEIQRLSLQKGLALSEDEQQALAESEQLFLGNQRQFQQLNTRIADLNEQLRDLQDEQRELGEQIDEQREPIRQRYEELLEQHNLKLAAVKLAVLLPLLLLAGFLFIRLRGSLYSPLVYSCGIAIALMTVLVMHEHFPTRYFKYILILVAIAAVVRVLVYLLRILASPGREWLLRQYREAYGKFVCPVCEYPIRRGPLRYAVWGRRGIKQLPAVTQPLAVDEPYSCPVCGTRLFEECSACHGIRHSLLPACEKCGTERSLPAHLPAEDESTGENGGREPAAEAEPGKH